MNATREHEQDHDEEDRRDAGASDGCNEDAESVQQGVQVDEGQRGPQEPRVGVSGDERKYDIERKRPIPYSEYKSFATKKPCKPLTTLPSINR